jgi:hypothetical protein
MADDNQTPNSGDWKESLPEQLRDAPYFKSAESVDQVLSDLTNAAGLQGNSLRIPGPDASDEDVAAFRLKATEKIPGLMAVPDPDSDDYTDVLSKMGLPEAADKYRVPEGTPIDADTLAQLAAEAHEAKLTQSQFNALVNKQAGKLAQLTEQQETHAREREDALRKEWGAAYEDRLGEVERLLSDAPGELAGVLPNLSADAVKWLHDLTDSFGEDNEGTRQADGQRARLTPDEAHEQAGEILKRLQSMKEYEDPRLYQSLVKKRVDLIRMAGQ